MDERQHMRASGQDRDEVVGRLEMALCGDTYGTPQIRHSRRPGPHGPLPGHGPSGLPR
jgi:hypothetical protein